jgi:hypothetical protein
MEKAREKAGEKEREEAREKEKERAREKGGAGEGEERLVGVEQFRHVKSERVH